MVPALNVAKSIVFIFVVVRKPTTDPDALRGVAKYCLAALLRNVKLRCYVDQRDSKIGRTLRKTSINAP